MTRNKKDETKKTKGTCILIIFYVMHEQVNKDSGITWLCVSIWLWWMLLPCGFWETCSRARSCPQKWICCWNCAAVPGSDMLWCLSRSHQYRGTVVRTFFEESLYDRGVVGVLPTPPWSSGLARYQYGELFILISMTTSRNNSDGFRDYLMEAGLTVTMYNPMSLNIPIRCESERHGPPFLISPRKGIISVVP